MQQIDDATIERLANEPWYVSARASQKDRFRQSLELINKHIPQINLAYDIGCANGQFSNQLACLARQVVALDINQERIEQNQFKYASVQNINFQTGNFLEMDISADCVDLVTALEVLYYFNTEQQSQFLAKAANLLQRDGYILLSANVFFAGHFNAEALQDLVQKYFTIVETRTIYRNLYYKIELPMIRWLDSINYLIKLRIFTPNILLLKKKFYPGIWNTLLLRPSLLMDKIIIPLARFAGIRILRSTLLYRVITSFSEFFSPDESRSQLIILARKKDQ